MSSFETIVRPVVFPNIRPPAARIFVGSGGALRTITEPGQGFAVIKGNPARQINLTTSTSISISRSLGQEIQRRVDRVRVYQKTDGDPNDPSSTGTVNRDNYVDIEVVNKLRTRDASGTTTNYYRRVQPADNIDILQRDIFYNTPYGGPL